MLAANNDTQASTAAPPVTIVVSNNTVDGLRTILNDATNSGATTEAAEGQEILNASDLTRKQWIGVLYVTNVVEVLC